MLLAGWLDLVVASVDPGSCWLHPVQCLVWPPVARNLPRRAKGWFAGLSQALNSGSLRGVGLWKGTLALSSRCLPVFIHARSAPYFALQPPRLPFCLLYMPRPAPPRPLRSLL